MTKCEVIAEAGVNHNGDEGLAFALVDAAIEAGADTIKFQTFKANNLVTQNAQQAQYQEKNTYKKESQLEMLSRLELSYDSHIRLAEYCKKQGINFLSTAFDRESLVFLSQDMSLSTLKIASGELTNAPLLLDHARSGVDLIISTGMSSMSDIEVALGVIAFGYLGLDVTPCKKAFQLAYFSEEGRRILNKKVKILHCTSEYPAPLSEVNLSAMLTLRDAFKLRTGYSDHTDGITIPIAAAALGATVIEKHFTLDKNMEGPDHLASLVPSELQSMIKAIRDIEAAMGDGVKVPTTSELKNMPVGRKSIVALSDIDVGDVFSNQNLGVKRPGDGREPIDIWELLGKQSKRKYKIGELIFD